MQTAHSIVNLAKSWLVVSKVLTVEAKSYNKEKKWKSIIAKALCVIFMYPYCPLRGKEVQYRLKLRLRTYVIQLYLYLNWLLNAFILFPGYPLNAAKKNLANGRPLNLLKGATIAPITKKEKQENQKKQSKLKNTKKIGQTKKRKVN